MYSGFLFVDGRLERGSSSTYTCQCYGVQTNRPHILYSQHTLPVYFHQNFMVFRRRFMQFEAELNVTTSHNPRPGTGPNISMYVNAYERLCCRRCLPMFFFRHIIYSSECKLLVDSSPSAKKVEFNLAVIRRQRT